MKPTEDRELILLGVDSTIKFMKAKLELRKGESLRYEDFVLMLDEAHSGITNLFLE